MTQSDHFTLPRLSFDAFQALSIPDYVGNPEYRECVVRYLLGCVRVKRQAVSKRRGLRGT